VKAVCGKTACTVCAADGGQHLGNQMRHLRPDTHASEEGLNGRERLVSQGTQESIAAENQLSGLLAGMGRVKPDSIRQPGTERFLAKLAPKPRFALCLGRTQLAEPPDADPHVRWCGRGEWATTPPMPIAGAQNCLCRDGCPHPSPGRTGF
jgi:hypothetical protein